MTHKPISIIAVVFGGYLVIEAAGSILFLEDDPLFNMGRFVRIIIGVFIIYIGYYRMLKNG